MEFDLQNSVYQYLLLQKADKAAKHWKKIFAKNDSRIVSQVTPLDEIYKLGVEALKLSSKETAEQTPPSSPKASEPKSRSKKRKEVTEDDSSKAVKKPNAPFQRVQKETVEFMDERLKDNTYMNNIGDKSDYGYKAHLDLIVTKGKGFRTEKNKKKRGSYRGGSINVSDSKSIKFCYSEDDD